MDLSRRRSYVGHCVIASVFDHGQRTKKLLTIAYYKLLVAARKCLTLLKNRQGNEPEEEISRRVVAGLRLRRNGSNAPSVSTTFQLNQSNAIAATSFVLVVVLPLRRVRYVGLP